MNGLNEDQPSLEIGSREHVILGTAGHIDHGKTSLVKALTGVNTDRLPEEQRRGMTIELGFAELIIPPLHFGIVDVPGHERLVRTMVAGATGIDLALIVVAGDDSVMPQTIEHVEVLGLMGIHQAVVAITKCDLVDDVMLDIVEQDIRELLERTPMAGADFVRVSSTTGAGIDRLKHALATVATAISRTRHDGPFRMAIDRVFPIQGRGTVVTGSVIQGSVSAGETLELLPSVTSCRVRDLQTHGQTSREVALGQRAALNLIGLDRDRTSRGHELAVPGYLTPAKRMDASFRVLPAAGRPIKPFSRIRVHMGTAELQAKVVPLDHQPLPPGARGMVQFRFNEPVVAAHGQRFIARAENGSRTIGGGIILRPDAKRWGSDRPAERAALERLETGQPLDRLEQVLDESGFEPLSDLQLAARSGLSPGDVASAIAQLDANNKRVALAGTDRKVSPVVIDGVLQAAERWLDRFHVDHPDRPGCDVDALVGWLERKSTPGWGRPLFDRFVLEERGMVRGRFVCQPRFAPAMSAKDERVYDALLTALRAGAFQPPSPEELAKQLEADIKHVRRLMTIASSVDAIVKVDASIYLAAENEGQLRSTVARLMNGSKGVAITTVREQLKTSRKYAVPFMEYLDRIGFTRREGDVRVLCEPST